MSWWQLHKRLVINAGQSVIIFFLINPQTNCIRGSKSPPVSNCIYWVCCILPRWTELVKIWGILQVIFMIFHRPFGQDSDSVVLSKALVEKESVWLAFLSLWPSTSKVVFHRVKSRIVVEKVIKDVTLNLGDFYSTVITQITFKCVSHNRHETRVAVHSCSLFQDYRSVCVSQKGISEYQASLQVWTSASS